MSGLAQPTGRTARRPLITTVTTLTSSALVVALAVSVGPLQQASSTDPSLAVVPVAAAQATGYARVTEPTASFFPNQAGTITGVIGSPKVRPIDLQVLTRGKWVTRHTTKTTTKGTFTFKNVKFASTATVRVESKAVDFIGNTPVAEVKKSLTKAERNFNAAQAKVDAAKKRTQAARDALKKARKSGKKSKIKDATAKRDQRLATQKSLGKKRDAARKVFLQARGKSRIKPVTAKWSISPAVDILVEKQRMTIGAIPPLAQASRTPAAAPDPTGALVNVRVVPARAGRTVTLQTYTNGAWVNGPRQSTDSTGNVLFPTTAGLRHRAVVSAGMGGTAETSTEVTTKVHPVLFEDEFDGTSLDDAKWSFQHRPLGNGLRGCAITDGSSSKVSGGILSMGVSKDPRRTHETCWHTTPKGEKVALPYMRNTQIDSQDKFSFKYGFAAARIQAHSAQGMHSSFWSHPNQALTPGRNDLGVEIDVMEYFGDDFHQKGIGTYTHSAPLKGDVIKTGQVYGVTQQLLLPGSTSYSQQYSVYSMEWTPKEYVFRIDGREYLRSTTNLSHAPQFLALSNLTSNWELMDLKNYGDTAKVDWVRVFKP
ncbi:glycoside hydrolase family 16 protein [Nocardioides yefusunii]|uniref:Family 16 glycosylhydrolase n=1 Tax=Nocardioides yefusunii TaxID=2500546 RepID=A0ABW1R0V7_9ACTN|nr:glycoside hydrolase family 16 protein [Nocardioides yefusunii]